MNLYAVALGIAAACAGILILVFPGYGLLLRILSRTRAPPEPPESAPTPPVTLIISAYNEEAVLQAKLQNALELDYPTSALEILVVSDASTDGTDRIVSEFAARDERVRLLRRDERRGKTSGLNAAMEQVRTPFVVFSDANAIYDPDAIHKLVRHFTDDKVGYVVGAAIYTDDPSTVGGRTEGRYWSKELRLKKLESDVSSVVGGDGAIYAIRAELYEPLRSTDINDYVNPMQIITKGFRGVFEPDARCRERTTGSIRQELRRKRRIVNRSFAGLLRTAAVLNPLRFGWFSVQVWLHKVLRWLSPLIAGFGLVAATGACFRYTWLVPVVATAWSVLVGLTLVLVGILPGRRLPLLAEGSYALGVAFSSARGILDLLRGEVTTTWETPRAEEDVRLPLPLAATLGSLLTLLLPVALVVGACTTGNRFWQEIAFIVAGIGMFGHFALYGGLLRLVNRLRGPAEPAPAMTQWPSVTLLVSAYNEEKVIEEKVRNALATRYPGRLEIVVASDACEDDTDSLVRSYEDRGVRLFRNPVRTGKAGLLRRALESVTTDLVVLSDANALYEPDAVALLAGRFADPKVGAVTGNVRLEDPRVGPRGEEVWLARFEKVLLKLESAHGSTAGVDGAMVAARRELIPAYEDGTILDDFVLSMSVANTGRRVVYEPEARGWELSAPTLRGEYERRARILAGIFQLYARRIGLPLRRSRLVLRFLGHKVWRWCAPVYSICFALMVFVLFGPAWATALLAGGFVLLYALLAAWRGFRVAGLKMGYLLVYQLAAVGGLLRALRGRQSGAWRRTER